METDDLDDWLENFGKVGKPGEPHPLADQFEAMTTLARAGGNLDAANLLQEMAYRLRTRLVGCNIGTMFRGIPCPDGQIIRRS